MGRKIYFEIFGGRFLLRAYIPSLRRSFSKRSRSKITRLNIYIYIYFLFHREFFFEDRITIQGGGEQGFSHVRTTIGKNSCTLQIWPRSRRNSGCLGTGENFRSIRLSNRSIVTPVFPSVLFIPATIVSLPLSVSSFNSRRTWIEGEGRAMMPEGMRGAHKRHLYPLQLAEL